VVRTQLKEKEENCEKLEAGFVSLKDDLEKSISQLNRILKFEKSGKTSDHIINF
jgi:hypothetical protein